MISVSVSGPLGARTATLDPLVQRVQRRHRRLLPGSVTVTWLRPAFGLRNALMTHGGLLKSRSPMSRPWFGSNRLDDGRRRAAGHGAASVAGAGDVADVELEVLDLVEDRRVVQDPLLVAVVAG